MNFCALRSPSFKVIWIIQLKNSFLLENLRPPKCTRDTADKNCDVKRKEEFFSKKKIYHGMLSNFMENKDLKLNESHLLLL